MNTKLIITVFLSLAHYSCIPPVPKEKMMVRLTEEWGERLGEDTIFTFKSTDTTDLTLPPIVTHSIDLVPPAGRTPFAYDTVKVNAIITKRGNVKRVWILSSTNSYFNKAVLKAILLRQYQPAMRKGIPFDTLITIPFPLKPQSP